MPTRTDIVIKLGEVIDCLPPSKAFKRRRYNSFDANSQGNEENLAPELSGVSIMKPVVKLEAEDDDEVSFRYNNGDSESSRGKPKRKTSAEKFLEDNVNYFQLEVLPSKTRSNKRLVDNGDSGDDEASKEGFHDSFLNFLKSKGVEKEESNGRSRHKSEGEREGRSRTVAGRSRSSHSPYHRSRSSHRAVNGRSKSRGRSKSKAKLGGGEDCEQSASESSDTEGKTKRPRRGHNNKQRETSPSGSDADSVSSRPTSRRSRRGKANVESEASSDEESKSRASSPVTKISPRKKRSELDKLLEAVDTSFHFETAAAERKRLNDSGLGPLEIDCSDTGSEASSNAVSKRKASESNLAFEEETKLKKQKVGNNLLKTASPGSRTNSELPSGSEQGSEFEYDGCGSNTAWNGWELLSDQLQSITHSPVEIDRLHFSFESEPVYEGWYSTYQRQDRGDELIFYPSSTTAPFVLPYEMPYGTFLPGKTGAVSRREETPLSCSSRSQSKATSPVRQCGTPGRKAKSRKVSETDSTDSSEDPRRGTRAGKVKGKQSTLPPLPAHLQEPNYRVSPRQHASTKSFLTGSEADGGVGELDDLAEAYIMRDEAELHFPNLSYVGTEDSNDSYSSESIKSRSAAANRAVESATELSTLVSSIDRFMQEGAEAVEQEEPAKIPPTRSRVSSDQLLSPKKVKKKKKQPEDVSPMDKQVADGVDPVLLDLLEDELPTVPLEELVPEPLELLETFSRCTSMAVCNKRWLKPSRMEALPSTFTPSPLKPKRRFLYKDDLPGFSIDSDMEAEKMPISKRRPKEEPKVEKIIPKVKEEEEDSEEDEEPKRKKRGPSPSKKKEADPSKPKRIIIYKDDLPGFEVLPDSDAEEAERKKKKGAKLAKAKAVKEEVPEVEKPKPKKTEAPVKAADDAPKPKRIIIYKDDLPGFEALPDSDVELEKLPGKKRGGKPGPKSGKKKKQAISAKIIEDEDKDSDSVSVDSFSSTSSGPKKKRKMNRTGFPSPKKKKVSIKSQEINNLSPKVKLDKNLVMNNLKGQSGSSDLSSKTSKLEDGGAKKKMPKQLKLDRFITKQQKPKSSHSENGSDDETANSRRSAAMKAKNYR